MYRIELGQDLDEDLYLELAIRNVVTGGYVRGDDIDHQLVAMGWAEDYGRYGQFGQVVASNLNGMITCPEPGIVCIAVPIAALLFGGTPVAQPPSVPVLPALLPGQGPTPPNQGAPVSPPYAPFFDVDCRRSLRFKLLAVPIISGPNDLRGTKTLAKGTISFGGDMPNPRITLMVYPLYPNSATASVATCQVAQMKQLLAQQGTYDKVEAGLGGTTDPATISWNAGATMSLGGPLANRISAILGAAPGLPIDLTGLITLAGNLPT